MAEFGLEHQETLLRLMGEGKLILFAGAGISKPSGLPSWTELGRSFIRFCEETVLAYPGDLRDEREPLQQLINAANARKVPDGLPELLQAHYPNYMEYATKLPRLEDPLETASALRAVLTSIQAKNLGVNVERVFDLWLKDALTKTTTADGLRADALPNAMHRAIISTDFPFILTTNYDELLEAAAAEMGVKEYALSSFTPTYAREVARAIRSSQRAIIHVHGSIAKMDLADFVFTDGDYARVMYDNAGLRVVMQNLFVSYSVLFVGYGGNDPHILDVLRELKHYFPNLDNHYLLILEDEADAVMQQAQLSSYNVKVLTVADHTVTEGILRTLQQEYPHPALAPTTP